MVSNSDWFNGFGLFSNYYNSKYIDAEETDVSRNQTSTWLMKAEVVSKEEIYEMAAGLLQLINQSSIILSFIDELLTSAINHWITDWMAD